DPASAVMGGAVGASLACAALAASGSAAMAVAAAAAAGLLLAPIFPTVLGVAAARPSGDTAPLFGVLFAVALTGGMTVPWLAGHLAAATGGAHAVRPGRRQLPGRRQGDVRLAPSVGGFVTSPSRGLLTSGRMRLRFRHDVPGSWLSIGILTWSGEGTSRHARTRFRSLGES